MRYFANLLICAAVLPFQYIAVPLLLLTKWDGYSTWFGNNKHGKGNAHFENPTKGFWQEFVWLTYRNPINNLLNKFGCICPEQYTLTGNPNVGDGAGKEGGAYVIIANGMWEFFYIKPFLKKYCIRVRLGWKIAGKRHGELCPMVFAIRPIMNYSGA